MKSRSPHGAKQPLKASPKTRPLVDFSKGFEVFPGACMIVDRNGLVEAANKHARQLLNLPSRSVLKIMVGQLFPSLDYRSFLRRKAGMVRTESRSNGAGARFVEIQWNALD